jgi:hypothetical protein
MSGLGRVIDPILEHFVRRCGGEASPKCYGGVIVS